MTRTRELSDPPSALPLYLRAAAPLLPGASRLPFVAGHGDEVPDLRLRLAGVDLDAGRLAAYGRVCGFRLRDDVPATYPQVLAFPLHMGLMTDGSFPFAPIGLVHIANRIVQHRPVRLGDRLDLEVWAGPIEPHSRGRQFTIHTRAEIGGEVVWEAESATLRRGGGAGGERKPGGRDADPEPPPVRAEWRLPGDLGRRYAGVSGDRNPIHLHPLSARAFGFPRAIVHGMWTKARCLAALEARLPQAFTVEVRFRKPILLPGTVTFGAEGDRFSVRDRRSGASHLDGTVIA